MFTILSTCQANDPPDAQDGVVPSVEPYLSKTPVPEFISLPDVKLEVIVLSENSVHITVTGLKPNEPVHVIFTSQANGAGKLIEHGPGESANEKGVYESSQSLRASNLEPQFTDLQVCVIHSGISTCKNFVQPNP